MGAGTGAGTESENSSGDGNGDEDNGNGNGNGSRIREGRREAKKCKKPHKSCRRHVGKGGDLGGKRRKCRKEKGWSSSCQPR